MWYYCPGSRKIRGMHITLADRVRRWFWRLGRKEDYWI